MICHILSSILESLEQLGFDSDRSLVIFDNSANAQIRSEEDIFSDNIETVISNGVETIGRKYLIQKGIVTFSWYWTDDEGKLHKKILNNVLYFTD